MNKHIEQAWEIASGPEKLRLLAEHVVAARVEKGNALSEFRSMLDFYQSEEWRHRGIPVEAVNKALDVCRRSHEVMDLATAVAMDRLNEAVVRAVPVGASPSQLADRLVFEAFARHGTDHSIEQRAVPDLLAAHDIRPDREFERERS